MLATNRNTAVDMIRLLALIGICVVNIVFLGLPLEVALSPATTPGDQVAAFVVEALFQSKFFLLFSFLFGWGIHVQDRSAHRAGVSFVKRYARRLMGLAVFGGLHAVLVFSGDILLIYALLGLLIWPLHGLTAKALVRVAYMMVPLAALSLVVLALMLPEQLDPTSGPGLGGSFIEATRARISDWPVTLGFLLLFQGPLVFGAFALGLAAGKMDFFDAGSSGMVALRKRLPLFLVCGLVLNIGYAAAMGGLIPAERELLSLLGFVGIALGGPLLSAVYLHLILRLNDRVTLPPLLVAAGQNSLSVYVLQGVIAGFLFGGYGLGLFGQISLAGLLPVGLGVALLAILIIGAIAKTFRRGPLEAVLRAVTNG